MFDSNTTAPAPLKPLALCEKRCDVPGQRCRALCRRGAQSTAGARPGPASCGGGEAGREERAGVGGMGTGRGKTPVGTEGAERAERRSEAKGGQVFPTEPQTGLRRCRHCSSSSDAVGVRPVCELCWEPQQDQSLPVCCGSAEQHRLSLGGPKMLSPVTTCDALSEL